MLHDLRIALRTLARSPGYTLVALVTLVLGIGANATVFSILQHVLLAPLPFPQPERLVAVSEVNGKQHEMSAAWRNFTEWRERSRDFSGLAAHTAAYESTVLGTGEPLRASVSQVSDGFLHTLGVAPLYGRGFLAEDHHLGAAPVAVVSYGFWRTYLGSTRDLASKPIQVGDFTVRVVGVMPPGFSYPAGADLWYPVELDEQSDSRTAHNYAVVGRLRPGTTLGAAHAELDGITRGFVAEEPGVTQEKGFEDYFPQATKLVPLRESLVGSTRRPLWILMAASLLVLLVACTNLGSATLARVTGREQEFAVRHALGAGRGRLVRTIVAETLVLAFVGTAIGLALGAVALRLLRASAPAGIPRIAEATLDLPVVLFALVLALGTAALAGVLPGLRATGAAARALRIGARAGAGPERQRLWKGMIAAEVALAVLLLVGSGLLLRSFWSVLSVQPGFRTTGLLTATVDPPSTRYGEQDARLRYYDELLARLAAIPGVGTVGLVTAPPPGYASSDGLIDVEGGPSPDMTADYQLVGGQLFRTLGMPLVEGRTFDARDVPGGDPVVVVSASLARQAWPGQDPIGKRITAGGMDDHWKDRQWATVIGVIGDIRQRDLTAEPRPTAYFSYRQRPFRSWTMTAVVRPGHGDAAALGAQVRDAVRGLDPDVPVRLATIESRLSDSLSPRRFTMLVIGVFAALALVLASVGVYGVVAYAVARRRREIGIRMALGAEGRAVRRQLQREYLLAGGAGALIGVAAALGLTRVMQSLLYEVRPTDPLTFAAVVALLGAAAWLASFVPALRGTRVDPLEAIQAE